MADIFISYANEDRDTAARLAALLESVGWQVWWDRRIPAGRTWRAVLADALVDMRCMIVLWSRNSVDSSWVAEEAEEARRLGKTLVPVLIQRVEPPIGFRAIQAADLANWDGSAGDSAVLQLVNDLKSLLGTPFSKPAEPREMSPTPALETSTASLQWFSTHWPKAALGVLAIAVLAALWHNWPNVRTDVPAPLPVENGRPETAPAPRLTHLSVSAERKNMAPSETLKLTATGRYSDGSKNDVTAGIQWSSSNTRVATVDEHGEVKALRAGTAQIMAKIGEVESSEWTLGVASAKPAVRAVAGPNLVALNVSAIKRDLFENEQIALRAQARYSDASEKFLSGGIEWQVSDRTIASVNTRGELVALRPGKVEVVARADNLASAPLTFVIREPAKIFEPPAKVVKAAEPPALKLPAVTAQTKAKIAAYIDRAESFREQGDYGAALAELEKARAIDAANEEIRRQIEQTKRACNAEKLLGSQPNC
ncbi:MAG TPA: TIR domain-containing protein [Candidatus Binatia bacterium]|jgi:hypothetical protein